MAKTLDTIILIIITGICLFLFYRALKEPMDQLFGLIKKAFIGIKDKITDSASSGGRSVITYD
jgi:hypothetical protein